MLKIIYSKDGKAFSDFDLLEQAQEIIDDYLLKGKDSVEISTGNIIYALRVLVSRNKLSYEKIVFMFNGELIRINGYGELDTYPIGFMDSTMAFMRELIRTRLK